VIARGLMLAAAGLVPGAAMAQAISCPIPRGALAVRPDNPTPEQPVRQRATGGYTLAISWSPNQCRTRGDAPSERLRCRDGRFGWTLHGLWPDGVGPEWPQYCRPADLVPQRVLRAGLCATPSAQLMQHEWAKHGTCMPGETPAGYFRRSNAMFRRLRYPDMAALATRGSVGAGSLAAMMAGGNRGIPADAMRVTADREGWLDEIWLCLDRRFRYRRCPAHQGGLGRDATVRIATPRR